MNQFSSLYYAREYEKTIADAIAIMSYCAEIDPQAQRVLEIMTRFAEVVTKWTKDHTYEAPELSEDLSCLYTHTASSRPSSGRVVPGPAMPALQEQGPSRIANAADHGLLTPPTVPKAPLLEMPSTDLPAAVSDSRMTILSPHQTNVPPLSLVGTRPSVSAHSSVEGSESLNGNIEFEFDGLWNSFINHLPPVSTVAPGISDLAPQFPPAVVGPPTEPFGAYTIPTEHRMQPPTRLTGIAPLFHSNFG